MIFPDDSDKAEGHISVNQAHTRLRVDENLVHRIVRSVCEGERCVPHRISIVLIGSAAMRQLNHKWKGGDYDTDVLSFPLGDNDKPDGEIYVNLDYAYDHCTEYGATFAQEVCRYVTHGTLHLIGYDDTEDADRSRIRLLEDRYLAAAGII